MKIKRTLAIILLFALCLGTCTYADIAYLPLDNFIEEHLDECQYENRYYFANSTEGCVTAYSTPTGSAKDVIPNGLEFYVSYTWADGEKNWGCIEYEPGSFEDRGLNCESGWVDMSSMTPRYDSEAFMEDHSSEIRDENIELSIEPQRSFYGYRYPGSGIVEFEFDNSGDTMLISISKSYTDAEGRNWGYIGYHHGIRNIWVCIDDPYSKLPAGAEFTEPEIYPAAGTEIIEDSLREAQGIEAYSTVIAIAVVIMAAAIYAYILIKKRRR